MRNKVVLVTKREEYALFEEALQKMIQEGGELFFANNWEEGQTIFVRESPQMLFVDAHFLEQIRSSEINIGCIVVLMDSSLPQILPQITHYRSLSRPIQKKEIQSLCQEFLLFQPSVVIPPM